MALKSASPSGDKLGLAEVLGHLLVIAPIAYETGIVTQYTKPGDKPSDAIRVDCAVLTAQKDDGTYGPIYRGVLWFNVVRLSLRKSIPDTINGDVVLARIGQDPAKPGQDPQYILVDAMGDAQAVAFAESWLEANPEFIHVAQVEARRVAAETPAAAAATTDAVVPGVPVNAGPAATAPVVAAVPAVPKAAAGPVALPGMGGQATQGGGAAAIPAVPAQPAASAALIDALSGEEKAALLALLTAQQG